jgi:2'-5' RNA ligase
VSRLFVAVWPPPELHGRLQRLERPDVPGVRWTTEDQWHVTLRFLGDVGDLDSGGGRQVMSDLTSALGKAAAGQAPLAASVAARPRPLGDRVWVLSVTGLDGLAAAVVAATRSVVPPGAPDRRRFQGHLTLARARRPGGLAGLGALAWPDLGGPWPVGEITLVTSLLRSDGARYQIESRWRLGPPTREAPSGR